MRDGIRIATAAEISLIEYKGVNRDSGGLFNPNREARPRLERDLFHTVPIHICVRGQPHENPSSSAHSFRANKKIRAPARNPTSGRMSVIRVYFGIARARGVTVLALF
jgi:hypothetical protein